MVTDHLPSWIEGTNKSSILHFVEAVTTVGGAEFVSTSDRFSMRSNRSRSSLIPVV
jgi:hypothetical protein